MELKIIKQKDDSVTFEFYNSKGEKIYYDIVNVRKDGLGYIYDIKGVRISSLRKKREKNE